MVDGGAAGELIDQARLELYRGQCNCSYWHGAFGGAYLPHLRNAVYQQLIAADNLLDQHEGRVVASRPAAVGRADRRRLQPRWPARKCGWRTTGWSRWSPRPRAGSSTSSTCKAICHNLLATLARRPEAYHREVLARPVGRRRRRRRQHSRPRRLQAGRPRPAAAATTAGSARAWSITSSPPTSTRPTSPRAGPKSRATSSTASYEAKLRRSDGRVQVQLTREGSRAGPHGARSPRASRSTPASATLEIAYLLENVPADIGAALGAGVQLRRPARRRRRPLLPRRPAASGWASSATSSTCRASTQLGLVDEWLGIDVGAAVRPARRRSGPTRSKR